MEGDEILQYKQETFHYRVGPNQQRDGFKIQRAILCYTCLHKVETNTCSLMSQLNLVTWEIECARCEVVWLLGWGHKRWGGFLLALPWSLILEKTSCHVMRTRSPYEEAHVKKNVRPQATSRVSEPLWKLILQPQLSSQRQQPRLIFGYNLTRHPKHLAKPLSNS